MLAAFLVVGVVAAGLFVAKPEMFQGNMFKLSHRSAPTMQLDAKDNVKVDGKIDVNKLELISPKLVKYDIDGKVNVDRLGRMTIDGVLMYDIKGKVIMDIDMDGKINVDELGKVLIDDSLDRVQ